MFVILRTKTKYTSAATGTATDNGNSDTNDVN